MTKSNFWVCGCATANGEHINEDHSRACRYCDARKQDCSEIVVPSGLGGVFTVSILEVEDDRARVTTTGNSGDFDDMPPFWVSTSKIERRTRSKGAAQ
ncbi:MULTISPECIES: hypothetical protein [Rhodobacterales]|uniref:Uncharacterized protein n=1 Tax=Pelagivirga sediminicola TaxID=2170575 RepID=A0A2T7G2R9_9RHOB|nr:MULTISPECIES: hypothetical protein [Rhodobacterales]MCQ0090226.1 hypothetical protein [Roseovarius sp. M141]PVA08722.1 hypothetical protein DC366_17805 [Pelagivirga sediminicola]